MLKYKITFIVLLPLLLFSCKNNSTGNTAEQTTLTKTDTLFVPLNTDTIKERLLVLDFIKKIVAVNHARIVNAKGNFNTFKQYIKTLNTHKLISVAFAMDYIKTCIPIGDTLAQDSIYLYFRTKFYDIVNAYPDSIYSKAMEHIEFDTTHKAESAFQDNLNQCGVGVFFTEGDGYYSEQPDYFYNNFKDRVSSAVKQFFNLRKVELKEGFSEDAGLVISFDNLYKRIQNWEKFLIKYPTSIVSKEAQGLYDSYLETLLTGMDNSRVFDIETNVLTPEMKTLYSRIAKEDTTSKTTKIVSSYYTLLSKHNFIGADSIIDPFMKGLALNTTIGVQPNTK